ncbi:2Fe-2S iron-sulfur cluster-binding protein [Actinorugispora endophytica]|uniref:NAD(P)H-flavin reductase n=1 Tax=Actinorugispora endophytica TaxID=1605990 RepID=A0A4R6V839_9ACTN|nr:2Fe-2S iron-sulfur cluster binding domain-containing protein [Actinorugispora endophytica]TDQ55442.1 NAD(P)H-flavin reductase [Actinorugispora endophytica]
MTVTPPAGPESPPVPPGAEGDSGGRHPVTLSTTDGEALEFCCGSGQSVLEAAAEAGVTLPASCRQGTCGSCHATATSGEYRLGAHSPQALPPDERRDRGGVLLCRTFPRGPLTATLPYDGSRVLRGAIPVREGVITALEEVAEETVRLEVRLEPDPEEGPGCQFEPGQFVELQPPGEEDVKRAYSLANTGNWDGLMEFFIRLRPGGRFSGHLRERARPGDPLVVRGPQGAFGLSETGLRPRWLVAGGTGLAPMLAMARHMVEWQEPHPVRLVLGVNGEADVFGLPELRALAAEAAPVSGVPGLPGFEYDVCVWRPGAGWRGPVGTPADLVRAGLETEAARPDVYVCGPPPLIDSVVEAAVEGGVPEGNVFRERFLPT